MESTVSERPCPELTEAVVAVVLGLLPTRNRLTSALVSRTWAAAAAATPPAADLQAVLRPDDSSCQSLKRFLEQHAGHICCMQLSSKANNKLRRALTLLQLPCGLMQLCSLSARRLELGLVSTNAAPPEAASAAQHTLLPQLRSVLLQQCMVPPASLEGLSTIQSLTSLHMHECLHASSAGAQWLSTALSQLLQQLPALADVGLSTSAPYDTPVHVQFPADSPGLERVTLGGAFARGTLAGLPASLTFLHLQPCGRSRCLRVDRDADQLAQLSNLQHLQLSRAEMPAGLLAQMTSVQRVTLAHAWAVAPLPEPVMAGAQPHAVHVHPLPLTSSRVRGLISALSHLPQLQHLECADMNDSTIPCVLRALTQLTALEVTEQGMPTECGVLQRVLLPLPQMRSLRLVAQSQQSGPRRSYSWDNRDKPSCLNGSDMRSIVDSFRNLEHLSLLGVVGPSVFAGCLASLSCLQSLCVSGPTFKDSVAAAVARMTGLKSLQWSDSDTLTVTGLQRLTALTALSRLEVTNCPGLPLGAPARSAGAQLLLECTQEGEPDAWRRLQWWCRHLQEKQQAKTTQRACRRSSSKADSDSVRDQQPRRIRSSSIT